MWGMVSKGNMGREGKGAPLTKYQSFPNNQGKIMINWQCAIVRSMKIQSRSERNLIVSRSTYLVKIL